MIAAILVALTLAYPGSASASNCIVIEAGDGGSPIVKASVNGEGPFDFVLDTASSGSTLDQPHIDQLRLPRDAQTEQAQGMGGPLDVRLYRVETFSIGPQTVSALTVPSIPAPAFDSHAVAGLAGVDIFGTSLAVWRSKDRCVAIETSGAPPAGERWSSIPAQWIQPWKIMLPLRIDGVDGWGLLDTGAQHTTLNPVFADLLGLTAASGRTAAAGSIYGLDGRELPVVAGAVGDARIGTWTFEGRTVKVGALPVFDRLGAANAPLAIIGMDWLAGRDFAVDYGAHLVWLRANAP